MILLCAGVGSAAAKPRPPYPPYPWGSPVLQHASFDELLGTVDASKWDAASLEEGWSGLLLRRAEPMVDPVAVPADVGASAPNTPASDTSAVVFWFSPTEWSSPAAGGEGPGHDAHLLQWIWMDGQRAAVWWTLSVPAMDLVTGVIDCLSGSSPWPISHTLVIPGDWISGVYVAKLTDELTAKQSYILFVVREDCRPSDLLFQCSVTTYQAYNPWGGNSLYPYPCVQTTPPCAGASKVSFNRPYAAPVYSGLDYATGAGEFLATINAEPYPGWEYNMVRWLERQGYDVTYSTSVDTHRHAPDDKPIKAFLSVGHDEYWSADMRTHVEAARDRGVNLGFFAANVCYWRIHFDPDSGERAFSVNKGWMKYDPTKDWGPAACGPCLPCDPCFPNALYDPNRPTAEAPYNASTVDYWRGPNVNNPEISMIGVQYVFNSLQGDIVIPNPIPSHWAFEHTAGLFDAEHRLPGLLGYEVDGYQEEPNCPSGHTPPANILATLVTLAHSPWAKGGTVCGQAVIKSGHSDMTIYTAASGARVFATGSMQWNWGLDGLGLGTEPPWSPSQQSPWGPSLVHPAAQQMTHNVLRTFSGQTRVPVLFTNADTITSGDWSTVYRPDVYMIAGWSPDNLPSYASSITLQGETFQAWSSQAGDPRALLKPGSAAERIAAAWRTTDAQNASFTIDLSLDGNIHPLALYCVDWEGTAPLQRMEVFDSSDTSFSNPLDTRELLLPPNGVYFVWKLSGHKTIRVTKLTATAGEKAMVSGILFSD